VLTGLALTEMGMRVAGVSFPQFYRPDTLLGQVGLPEAEGWHTQEGGSYLRINAAGFRDRDHPIEKPPGRRRIAVLGDSFADARHVELEETFWSVAQRDLAGCPAVAGEPPEILNFGVEGYGTAQELLLLRERVWPYQPDWVVLAFFVGNDLRNNSKALQKGGRPYFVYQGDALVLDTSFNDSFGQRLRTGPLGRGFYELLPRSRVLQLAFEAMELRRRKEKLARVQEEARSSPVNLVQGDEPGLDNQVYREPSDPDWKLAWRTTEDLLRMVRDEVRARGARFLLVTLSTGIQVYPDPAVRERFASVLGIPDLDYPDERLRAFAESEGIEILTLVPPLRRHAEAIGACVHGFGRSLDCGGHWNAIGHRIAGNELARRLCADLSASQAGSGGVRSSTSKASWRTWSRRISSRSSSSLTTPRWRHSRSSPKKKRSWLRSGWRT
jgi:hypothetical protein